MMINVQAATSRLILTILVSITLLLVGCSGGGSSSTQGFTTGLQKDKPIGRLSQEEVEGICASMQNYADNFIITKEEACTFIGVITLENPAECSDYALQCINDEEVELESSFECPIAILQDKECTATGAELDRCFNDVFKVLDRTFSELSCNAAGDKESLDQLVYDFDYENNIDSCRAVKSKCPRLFEDEED